MKTKSIDSDGVLQNKNECKIEINPKTKRKVLCFPKKGTVKQIKSKLFMLDKNFQEVIIPNTVEKIGRDCFKGCSKLESIVIPDTVSEIEDRCFSFCANATNVRLSNNITKIPEDCFLSCAQLSTIDIPNNIKSLGSNCFYRCSKLKNICIPESVTEYGEGIFGHCTSLQNFSFNDNVLEIPSGMFTNCISLDKVALPPNLQKIGKAAFEGCDSLQEIQLPNSLRHIEKFAFNSCPSLKSITIPANVTSIDKCSFEYCSQLESVTVLARFIKSLQSRIFWGCDNIKEINIPQLLLSEDFFDFSHMPNLKSIICDNSQLLQLSENETFKDLKKTGKYIYIKYNDSNDNPIYMIKSSKVGLYNTKLNNEKSLESQFSKLINHPVFENYKDENRKINLCLNMMSVLGIDTCQKFLDLVSNREEENNDKLIKSTKRKNKFTNFFNKLRNMFHNGNSDSKPQFYLTPIQVIDSLFSNVNTNLSNGNCRYFDKFFAYNIEQISEINDFDTLSRICEIQKHFDKFMEDVFLKKKCEKCNLGNTDPTALTLDEILNFEKMFLKKRSFLGENVDLDRFDGDTKYRKKEAENLENKDRKYSEEIEH